MEERSIKNRHIENQNILESQKIMEDSCIKTT